MMNFLKDWIIQYQNKFSVGGVETTIDRITGTVSQEGDTISAAYLNEIQKNCIYQVNATRVIEGVLEIYDISIDGSEEFDVFDTQFLINFNETNTKLNPVLRFNNNNYYIRALKGFIDIDIQIGSLQKTYIGFLDSANNKLKLMNYETKLTFDTMAHAQAYNEFVEGQRVEVLGYYSKNDGAGHERVYSLTDDGSGIACGSGFLVLLKDIVFSNEFGLKFDGTDETTLLTKFLNYSAKTKKIIKGNTISTAPLTLKEGTTLKFYNGSYINFTGSECIFMENDTKIYNAILIGQDTGIYNSKSGIRVLGELGNYKNNISIYNSKISNIGGNGIGVNFCKNLKIKNCKINDIGYSGIGLFNVENVDVYDNIIKDITPGTSGHMYGIYASRTENDSIELYPRSKNIKIIGNHIENVNWEGIDTHGGEDFLIEKNRILNCKGGIYLVNSDNGSQVETFAPRNLKVINNYIEGNGTGSGILIEGVSESEKTYNNIISDNTLINCGEEGNGITGAIKIYNIKDSIVKDNIIKNPLVNGIYVYAEYNKNVIISENIIIDPNSSTITIPTGIFIPGNYNEIILANNSLKKVNTSLNTYVAMRGIRLTSGSLGNSITLGNNDINYDIKIFGVNGSNSNYMSMYDGDLKIYAGVNTPESVVTAKVGSLYLRSNGGANTTLYIKESGTGNTGWIAK